MTGPQVVMTRKSSGAARTLPVDISIQTEVSANIIRRPRPSYRVESARISERSPSRSTLPI